MDRWSNRRVGWVVVLVALLALLVAPMGAGTASAVRAQGGERVKAAEFKQDMRKLWEDHIVWTRMVIVSVFAELPDLQFAVERLLQNQEDLGDAIKPYYGEAAGEQLTTLLREHITIAAELLLAARAGDTVAFEDANTRWYANADAIAAFLNAANPRHWPLEEMQAMMKEHLDLTLAEAVARLSGDFAADVAAYDAIHLQILEMADMLSMGIIKQFPGRFTQAPLTAGA